MMYLLVLLSNIYYGNSELRAGPNRIRTAFEPNPNLIGSFSNSVQIQFKLGSVPFVIRNFHSITFF